MKCIKYTLVFFASFWAAVFSVKAQKQPESRKTENMLLQEKLFIDAMREKIIGDEAEAISLLNELVKKDTDKKNAAAHYQLAKIYINQKNGLEDALREAEIAAKMDEKIFDYQLFYANLLETKGEYKPAIKIYEQLTKIYPDKVDLYIQWAFLLTKMDENNSALKVYNKLQLQIGIQPELSLRKYQLHLAMNKPKLAEEELLQLSQTFPNDIAFLLKLADFYQNQKRGDNAQKIYTQVLQLDPNQPEANLKMVDFLRTQGDEKAYLNALLLVFENPQQTAENKVQTLAPLLEKALKTTDKNYKMAVFNLAEKLQQTHPDNNFARFYYAQMLQDAQKYDLALELYMQTARNFKNNLEFWRAGLETALAAGKITELNQLATETAELFPNHSLGFYYLALAQNAQNQSQKALVNAEQALLWANGDVAMQKLVYQQMAKIYTGLNQPEKAAQALQKSDKLQPK